MLHIFFVFFGPYIHSFLFSTFFLDEISSRFKANLRLQQP
jgi:hypothetical protein